MEKKKYTRQDFNYQLPTELIAQEPSDKREESKLLIGKRPFQIKTFKEITSYFSDQDILVLNHSRVIPARVYLEHDRTGKEHEFLFLSPGEINNQWTAIVGRSKRLKDEDTFTHPLSQEKFELIEKAPYANQVKFQGQGSLIDFLEKHGQVPLPPYINRPPEDFSPKDKERYQTVFAKEKGSVAAPTAGLHFNDVILKEIEKQGTQILHVTLHVGPGTFLPVKTEYLEEHQMHSEFISLSSTVAQSLNQGLKEGKKITACGTTALRVLESTFKEGNFNAFEGQTTLFIHPPMKVKSTHRLITNFHQPESTLLMLVSSFTGKNLIDDAYQHAINQKMRFFSYGDATLLWNPNL